MIINNHWDFNPSMTCLTGTSQSSHQSLIIGSVPIYWRCSWCGTIQPERRLQCSQCGGSRDDERQTIPFLRETA